MREKVWIGHGETKCVLCNENKIESLNHMFFDCTFSRKCVTRLYGEVKFIWPRMTWGRRVLRVAKRWRGKHLVNCSYRILLAILVYSLWRERNSRICESTHKTPEEVAARVLNIVKDKLLTMQLDDSIQSRAVKRLWHIAW